MQNDNYKKIEQLNVSVKAKDVLKRINRVAGAESFALKSSIKSLFVVCPHGAGLSNYARLYETIIISNGVYPVRGKGTYLELAFPRMGTDREYTAFYNSPRLVAATQNDFYGIFLISFEQWSGFNELANDKAFKDLVGYIDRVKNKVSFVFHVLPDFSDAEELFHTLNGHVNIERLQLEKPKMKEAMAYVTDEMKKTKIYLSEEALNRLDTLIETTVDTDSEAYLGFETLKRLADNLIFEAACICDADDDGIRNIDSTMMTSITETICFSIDEGKPKQKIGFIV